MPNRVGSSEVKITSSIGRRGRYPARCNVRIASSPPSTPTVPSKRPALGIASMCEPVPTGGKIAVGSVPASESVADGIVAEVSPASRQSPFTNSRPRSRLP